jgi:hypothetical protein
MTKLKKKKKKAERNQSKTLKIKFPQSCVQFESFSKVLCSFWSNPICCKKKNGEKE